MFLSAGENIPSYPKKITYGLFRAKVSLIHLQFISLIHVLKAVKDIIKHCDDIAKRNMTMKFGHSEATQRKSYGFLAHNSVAVEAVEAIQFAQKIYCGK